MLDSLFGAARFEVVVTADEAPVRKPDPSAHLLALERLGLAAAQAPAIEDSLNGLQAAKAAHLACVIVVNDYTREQDFEAADLVLDGFGGAGGAARVLSNPHGVAPPGRLDVETLRRLAGGRG
jgi:beta-phosphoglucomutase-like phosphatase (HAD superfamily)